MQRKTDATGKSMPAPLLRYGLLGGACFSLNLLLMWTLVAVAVLNLFSHHYSRELVFGNSGRRYSKSLIRYSRVMAASFALNLAAMAIATQWLEVPYLLASALIAGLFFLGNFVAHRDWTFR